MSLVGAIATVIAIINLPTQLTKSIFAVLKHKRINGVSSNALLLALIVDVALLNYSIYYSFFWSAMISVIGFITRVLTYVLNGIWGHNKPYNTALHCIMTCMLIIGMFLWLLPVTMHPYVFSTVNIVLSSVAFVPQLKILLYAKKFNDVISLSALQYWLWSFSNIFWALYALEIYSFTVGVPAVVRFVLAVIILVKYHQLKRFYYQKIGVQQ